MTISIPVFASASFSRKPISNDVLVPHHQDVVPHPLPKALVRRLVLSAHDASVCIHPVDRPMLENALPDLLKELATLEHIELVDDEAITPGGCVVAFGQGRIDATIERQLQRAQQTYQEYLDQIRRL